jgi:hypothetical protein
MMNRPISERIGAAAGGVMALLRQAALRFVLPVLLLGPVMYGAELAAIHLGYTGGDAQFVRLLALGLYLLMIVGMIRRS